MSVRLELEVSYEAMVVLEDIAKDQGTTVEEYLQEGIAMATETEQDTFTD